MTQPDPLQRFLEAQAAVYESALAELRAGHKRGHWMWFVFPQLDGLGRSETARYFGIGGAAEARAYAAHAVLGARLRECTEAVLGVPHKTAHDIFGSPDDMKLRSSLTLFGAVAPEQRMFAQALQRFFVEGQDPRTLQMLSQEQ